MKFGVSSEELVYYNAITVSTFLFLLLDALNPGKRVDISMSPACTRCYTKAAGYFLHILSELGTGIQDIPQGMGDGTQSGQGQMEHRPFQIKAGEVGQKPELWQWQVQIPTSFCSFEQVT